MSDKASGRLLILSGPSGSGKTTVGEKLVERGGIRRVVTATSRLPRTGEVDGTDYIFLSDDEFERKIKNGEFLEHVKTLGFHYGTPAESVERITAAGDWALCIIDVKGARCVREKRPDAVTIFLLPPSREELERRLRGRGTEDNETIERRLRLAETEMREKDMYDHVVVNNDASETVCEIEKILFKYGWRN